MLPIGFLRTETAGFDPDVAWKAGAGRAEMSNRSEVEPCDTEVRPETARQTLLFARSVEPVFSLVLWLRM